MGITLYPAVLYTGTTLGEADAAALAAAGVDEIVLPETAHTSGTVGDNVTRSAEWDRGRKSGDPFGHILAQGRAFYRLRTRTQPSAFSVRCSICLRCMKPK